MTVYHLTSFKPPLSPALAFGLAIPLQMAEMCGPFTPDYCLYTPQSEC